MRSALYAALLTLVLMVPVVLVDASYWLIVREWYRYQWHHQRITVGQFFNGLDGAPSWLRKSTVSPLWSDKQTREFDRQVFKEATKE